MLSVLKFSYIANPILSQLGQRISCISKPQLLPVFLLHLCQHWSLPIYISKQDQQD